MRGFVQGSLWGLVIGSAGLGFASLVNEQPQQFASGPPTPQLVAPQLDTVEPAPSVSVPVTSEETPVFTQAGPLEPAVETSEATPDVSTEPATPPVAAEVATALDTAEPQTQPEVDSVADAPIASIEDEVLPEASPEVESDMAGSVAEPEADDTTQTAVVVEIAPEETEALSAQNDAADAPLITILETPAEPTNDIIVNEDPAVTRTADEAVSILEVEPTVDGSDTTEAEAVVEEPQTAQTETAVDEVVTTETVVADDETSTSEANDIVTAEVVTDPPVTAAPEPEVQQPEEETQSESAVVTPTPDPEPTPSDGTVETTLPQTAESVRVNRPGANETNETPQEAEVAEAASEDIPALERFAAPFENPEGLPVIAIILLDEGATDGPTAVADLGFVPTVAVDALSDGTAENAAAYRAAGVEVAMQISLPAGALPTDVEVAFEAAFDIVPEAAMFFSDGSGIVQGNRSVTAQVMEILAAKGRGFVTVRQGLGNAVRAAAQEEVPATEVLRDLDGDGESQRAIERALDQAAFRARQSGGAVLMGRLTPQTVSALREWAASIDPETLLIAPVSAVLLDQQE